MESPAFGSLGLTVCCVSLLSGVSQPMSRKAEALYSLLLCDPIIVCRNSGVEINETPFLPLHWLRNDAPRRLTSCRRWGFG